MIDTIHGPHSSAIIYSIAETERVNNLKLYDYFMYLFEEIPKHMNEKDCSFIEDLLPRSQNSQKKLETNSKQKPPDMAVLNFFRYSCLSVYI